VLNKCGEYGDADWVAKYVAASEDARAEGIRWVEEGISIAGVF